ncbi:MTH865 family protein [Haloferax larsenii]|uniref:MTH865-like family protein n=1 Tax=Haloferax larsenii TaxID=302484 RepID=A0A1H7S1M7_HALLR|nr:MTH865 family protein [Haloferax larsenii]SEL66432.1 hypothetical protein SAMN04488691_106253 [Haloferax larsenii]
MTDADSGGVRTQLEQAFSEVNLPITGPHDLSAAFRSGDNTSFEIADSELTPSELQLAVSPDGYPYETVEAFVDELVEALDDDA